MRLPMTNPAGIFDVEQTDLVLVDHIYKLTPNTAASPALLIGNHYLNWQYTHELGSIGIEVGQLFDCRQNELLTLWSYDQGEESSQYVLSLFLQKLSKLLGDIHPHLYVGFHSNVL